MGSRGGAVEDDQLWKEGPTWLSNRARWPADVTLEATAETRAEAKVKQEVLAVTSTEEDEFDQLLKKHELHKVLHIGAWIQRFITNCGVSPKERKGDAIVTEEIEKVKVWWIKRAQRSAQQDTRFQSDQLHLNLQPNDQEILECRGRISGEFPTYLPDSHPFTVSNTVYSSPPSAHYNLTRRRWYDDVKSARAVLGPQTPSTG